MHTLPSIHMYIYMYRVYRLVKKKTETLKTREEAEKKCHRVLTQLASQRPVNASPLQLINMSPQSEPEPQSRRARARARPRHSPAPGWLSVVVSDYPITFSPEERCFALYCLSCIIVGLIIGF